MKLGQRPRSIDQYVEIDISFPLYNVFVGKGSQENIKKALKLAAAFGMANGSMTGLQQFCDQNIGIDCSGFASNYFGLNAHQACNTGASVMAPVDKRIRKLEQVREGTAIVFKSGLHVALVDKVTQVDRLDDGTIYAATCMVAESTNDEMVEGSSSGLNDTEYTLLGTNNKYDPYLFKVLRPLKSSSNGIYEVDVHLANWPQGSLWD
ncbi:MAG: hypothetical protein PSX80_14745 [bacterium]|nr:hypothetical protein [bacterium]